MKASVTFHLWFTKDTDTHVKLPYRLVNTDHTGRTFTRQTPGHMQPLLECTNVCRGHTHTVRESVQLQKGVTLVTYSFALEQNRQTKCSRMKNLCAFCLSMNGIRDALIRYSASVLVPAKITGSDIGEGKKSIIRYNLFI